MQGGKEKRTEEGKSIAKRSASEGGAEGWLKEIVAGPFTVSAVRTVTGGEVV